MSINEKAVEWALDKVGCKYSQPKRLQEGYYDCSSLVARAYNACGAKFSCKGAPVPTSNYEVYDDNFELIWPSNYDDIGKTMGGSDVIKMATEPGCLQFLRTSSSSRSNKITHVTMVVDSDTIVHARGTSYGVRTDKIDLYKGKVCAVVKFNPNCKLRKGHQGDRVRKLQEELNKKGANLEVDGIYGSSTEKAVEKFNGKNINTEKTESAFGKCTGSTVNIRSGPSTSYSIIGRVNKGDKILFIKDSNWYQVAVEYNGKIINGYMSNKYIEEI